MKTIPSAEEASRSRVEGVVDRYVYGRRYGRGPMSVAWAYNSLVKGHDVEEVRSVLIQHRDRLTQVNAGRYLELAAKFGVS